VTVKQWILGTTFGSVVTDVDALGSRLTKRIVIHDIPLLIVIFRVTAQIVTDYRLFVFLREDRDISYSYPSTAWSLERTSTSGLLFHGISMHGSSHRYVSNLRPSMHTLGAEAIRIGWSFHPSVTSVVVLKPYLSSRYLSTVAHSGCSVHDRIG
jgi:hypothetical protein